MEDTSVRTLVHPRAAARPSRQRVRLQGQHCWQPRPALRACPKSPPAAHRPPFAQTHLCVVFQRIQLPLVEHTFPFALLQNEQTRKKTLHHSTVKGKTNQTKTSYKLTPVKAKQTSLSLCLECGCNSRTMLSKPLGCYWHPQGTGAQGCAVPSRQGDDLEVPGARHSPWWRLLRAQTRRRQFSCQVQVTNKRGTLTTSSRVHRHSAVCPSFLWSTRSGTEQSAHGKCPSLPENPLSLNSATTAVPDCSRHRGTLSNPLLSEPGRCTVLAQGTDSPQEPL